MRLFRMIIYSTICWAGPVSAQQKAELVVPARQQQTVLDNPLTNSFSMQCRSIIAQRLISQSMDRLSPLNLFSQQSLSAQVTASMAKSVALDSIGYSAREIMVASAYVVQLRTQYESLGDFIANSIGNIDEEIIDPSRLTYQPSEISVWNGLRQGKWVQYGIRPYSDQPYVYVTTKVSADGSDILFLDLRCYQRQLAGQRVSMSLGIPFSDYCMLAIGTEYRSYAHARGGQMVTMVAAVQQRVFGGILSIGTNMIGPKSIQAAFTAGW